MLKTNNYLDKNYNEVKSVVALAQVDTENNKVYFHIGISREAIENGNIIETKILNNFKFPRNVNPYEHAYQKAKEQKTIEYVVNGEKKTAVINSLFNGWEDDIQE